MSLHKYQTHNHSDVGGVSRYSMNRSTMEHDFVHLTNVAVQKKVTFTLHVGTRTTSVTRAEGSTGDATRSYEEDH